MQKTPSLEDDLNPRSYWTPRAVLLVGIMFSIIAISVMIGLIPAVMSSAPGEMEAVLPWTGLLILTTSAAGVFLRIAIVGYRRGRIEPLSYQQQLLAACLLTIAFGAVAVNVVRLGQWFLLPVFVLNPMLILTWSGVHKTRQGLQRLDTR